MSVLSKGDAVSYYLLGAFMTDGNVCVDKSRVGAYKISLSSKDKDWLDLIQAQLGGEGKLRKDSGKNSSYTLWLYGKEIFDWLVSNHCTPKKSLTLEAPKIPSEYLPDFLRGCIDGDGCVSRAIYKSSKNGYPYEQITVYLCGASTSFMTNMSQQLTDMGFSHSFITVKPKPGKIQGRTIRALNRVYRIQFCGKKAVAFLDYLYSNDKIAMPRKSVLSKSIISHYQNGGNSRL